MDKGLRSIPGDNVKIIEVCGLSTVITIYFYTDHEREMQNIK